MKLATLLECSTDHPDHLEACLQKADAGKIASKQYDILDQPAITAIPFAPHADGDFLPDNFEVGVCVSAYVTGGGGDGRGARGV